MSDLEHGAPRGPGDREGDGDPALALAGCVPPMRDVCERADASPAVGAPLGAGGPGPSEGSAATGAVTGPTGQLWRTLQPVVFVVIAVVAIDVLWGRRGELSDGFEQFARLRWWWVVPAAMVEAGSIACYARLQRRLLAAGGTPFPYGPLVGITLAGNAIQNSLPAGQAMAAVFAFGQFRRRGVDTVLATWTLAISTLVTTAVLVGLAVVGVGIALHQASSLDLVVAVVGTALLTLVVVALARSGVASRSARGLLLAALRAGRGVARRPADPDAVAADIWGRVWSVRPAGRDWAAAAGWALANWLLDCACLAFAFPALHYGVPWRSILLAYGAGQLASNLPITPGGLGVVEGSITVALVVYGGSTIDSAAAVLLYRVLSFWALLPVGWTSWSILKWRAR